MTATYRMRRPHTAERAEARQARVGEAVLDGREERGGAHLATDAAVRRLEAARVMLMRHLSGNGQQFALQQLVCFCQLHRLDGDKNLYSHASLREMWVCWVCVCNKATVLALSIEYR